MIKTKKDCDNMLFEIKAKNMAGFIQLMGYQPPPLLIIDLQRQYRYKTQNNKNQNKFTSIQKDHT